MQDLGVSEVNKLHFFPLMLQRLNYFSKYFCAAQEFI